MYYHDEDDRREEDTDTYEDKREDTFDNTLGNIKDSLDDIKKELNGQVKQSAKLKEQLDKVDDNSNDPDLQKIKRVQDLNEVIETLFEIQKESNLDNVHRLCNHLLSYLQPKANSLMREFIENKSR